jgi:Fe-S-cluster-containing dehydrogenase component
MTIDRRAFLKAIGGGALLGATGSGHARPNKEAPPNAVGILYDSTLCIGCKACVTACRQANLLPVESEDSKPIWDAPVDLSPQTFNVVKLYRSGNAEIKDSERDGYAFVKRNCLHCIDAVCVSVCPVSAMRKDPQSGIVDYNPDTCIGCRYCVYACPFGVAKFELDKAFGGEIKKCELCHDRLAKGQLPACVEVCPTGAALFGTREKLIAEGRRRIEAQAGAELEYPMLTVDSRHRHVKVAPRYQQRIYGERELGGTQVLYLSSVPFEKLGLPSLPDRSYAGISEGLQHSIYKFMALPTLLLGALLYLVHRNVHRHGDAKAPAPETPDAPDEPRQQD